MTFSFSNWTKSVVLFATLASSAFAGSLTFNGTTAGGSTWNRPFEYVNALSGRATAVPYEVTLLSVDLGGTYVFQSTATSPADWDNYSFLYHDSFDPTSQSTNALIGNDDNPVVGLSGFSIDLTAGTSYLLVITGFTNDSQGAYSETITGPGNIALSGAAEAPEPASMLLFGSGILVLLGTRRGRRQSRE